MTRRPDHLPLPEPAGPYGPYEVRLLAREEKVPAAAGVRLDETFAGRTSFGARLAAAIEERLVCVICGTLPAPWRAGSEAQCLCERCAITAGASHLLVIRGADEDTEDLHLEIGGVRVWRYDDGDATPEGDLPDWAADLLTGDWVTPAAHPLLPVAGRKWLPVAVERGWAESRTETPEERQSRGAHTLGQPARAYRLTVAGVAPFRAALPRWSVGRG